MSTAFGFAVIGVFAGIIFAAILALFSYVIKEALNTNPVNMFWFIGCCFSTWVPLYTAFLFSK